MERKVFAKQTGILKVVIISLILVLLLPFFSFAEDSVINENNAAEISQNISDDNSINEESDTAVTNGSSEAVKEEASAKPSVPQVTPRQITAKDIARYSTYKGKNASRIPVITYHQIVSDKEKKSKKYRKDPWSVSQSNFNKQMAWLHKKHYRTINCDEFYLWYKGKIKLPKRTVLITFDDGYASAMNRSLPVLKKYKFKATHFIIGKHVHAGNSKTRISETRMRQIMKSYPNIDFQSHTYNLHYKNATKLGYNAILKDANTQKQLYGFSYLAYPYGRKTNNMIRAYKKSGIKMAFSFADYGYATRKQNLYKIKRLAVKGNTSLRKFKRWCS